MKLVMLARNPNLYSHRRIIEAARQRGHEIDVVNTLHVHMNITSSKPTLMYGGRNLPCYDAVIPPLGAPIPPYRPAVPRPVEKPGGLSPDTSVATCPWRPQA